jgi:hypothetical protein
LGRIGQTTLQPNGRTNHLYHLSWNELLCEDWQ